MFKTNIRLAENKDYDAYLKLTGATINRADYIERISEGGVRFAEVNDLIVGVLEYHYFLKRPICDYLFVEMSSRNNGFGSELLKNWEEEMKERGYEVASIVVFNSFPTEFIKNRGYVSVDNIVKENNPSKTTYFKSFYDLENI